MAFAVLSYFSTRGNRDRGRHRRLRRRRERVGLIGTEQGLIAFIIGLVVPCPGHAVLAPNVPKYLVCRNRQGGAAAILLGWFLLIGKVPADHVTWLQSASDQEQLDHRSSGRSSPSPEWSRSCAGPRSDRITTA